MNLHRNHHYHCQKTSIATAKHRVLTLSLQTFASNYCWIRGGTSIGAFSNARDYGLNDLDDDVSDDEGGDEQCRFVMKIRERVKMEVAENDEGDDEEGAMVVA
ncbi:unnamed protein product [Vicia faba]|uniref:Uncharacterized protein n=1 Tax=Vicia faba TaxID=3906 RepID=A0AAV0Z9C9_VICFA|nr:unnamed protein product [Vicia faba]